MRDLYFYDPLSRRAFIRGLSGWVAAPLLTSLLPKAARAATANNRSLVTITTPNQCPSTLVFPSHYSGRTVPQNLLSRVQNKIDGTYAYRETDLAAFIEQQGYIGGLLDAKFNTFKSQLSIFRGLDIQGRVDHGRAVTLGNVAASKLGTARKYKPIKTLDEVLADSLSFYQTGRNTFRFPVLRMGESSLSTSLLDASQPNVGRDIGGANAPLTLNGNLQTIFNTMFLSDPTGPTKRSVVDKLRESVRRLQAGKAIGAVDKSRLDEYLERLKSLDSNLVLFSSTPAMAKPARSFLNTDVDTNLGERVSAQSLVKSYYENCADLAVLAIQCGASRIITIGVDSSNVSSSESVTHRGAIRVWHEKLAHEYQNDRILSATKFISDSVLYRLLTGLSAASPNGGTYLDESLIFQTSEMAHGHSGINYSGILAGNSTGGLRHGFAYEYGDWSRGFAVSKGDLEHAPGQPMNRLWVGILQSMGLQPSDYLTASHPRTFGIYETTYENSFESYFGEIRRTDKISSPLNGLFSD